MSFLPTPSIRKIITVPTEDKTDFRAACFCHKHIVDVGYVCSVCLSSSARSITLPTYHHSSLPSQSSASPYLSVPRAGKPSHSAPSLSQSLIIKPIQDKVPDEDASEIKYDSRLLVDRHRHLTTFYASSHEWNFSQTGIHGTRCKSTLKLRSPRHKPSPAFLRDPWSMRRTACGGLQSP